MVHLSSSCYVSGCGLGGANIWMSKTKFDLVRGDKVIIGCIIHPGLMDAVEQFLMARGRDGLCLFCKNLLEKDSLPRTARSEPNAEGAQWVPGVRTFQREKNSASVAESCRVFRPGLSEGDDVREDPKGKIRGDSVD